MIKGYTAEEVAESEKQKLIKEYDFCKRKISEIRQHEEIIESIRKDYNDLIVKYRMESVDRVLAYIRAKKITDSTELDTLLCHCQNKLHGNIDGIEITLKESEE